MRLKTTLFNVMLAALVAVPALQPARADEGMWTFDNFPAAQVKQLYGVDITPAWLDKVRLATVRLSNCTASFVSPDGLILTNHHCAVECLSQLSTPGHDLIEAGYAAAGRTGEPRCATQRADVLVAMEDITAKVNAATRGLDAKAANDKRRMTLTALEEACEQASARTQPLKCESVELYQGGQYFLYKYKRYSDVRLVFAPENAIAAFGGDPDNFQFPRWDLDFSIMRAYENGRPAATPDYRKIDWNGPRAGEAVFVPGHPGTTDRLLTVAQLQRTAKYIHFWLLRYAELRGRLIQFSSESPAHASMASDVLFSIENSIKVRRKQLDALLDDRLMSRKQTEEAALRAEAGVLPAPDPWQQVAQAAQREQELSYPYVFIEQRAGFNSTLYGYAIALVRAAAERTKPNADRLREYTDAALPELRQQIDAPVPIHNELEELTLSFGLDRMREYLGPDYPLVQNLLKEDSPDSLAKSLVENSKLADPAVRKALWDGGEKAIEASTDPMIRIARLVDPMARALRKQYEDEYEAPNDAGSERIAAVRFKAYGTSVYPDATFTLRLNYGTVQGWVEDGTPVEPFTHLDKLYTRATGQDPFRVPDSWLKVKDRLDMTTPFNLSTNNDIVGGNSGSALLNARGDIVGLMFDGNIHSISGSYWFDPQLNRAVAVHPAIIKLALTRVYDVPGIARELGL
jgi:Peptidase S46